MKKINKKGFTLIELLAVIIILGILLIIAVPAVTKYIENSKVESYVDTVKNLAREASNKTNSGTIKMHDPTVSYYIPVSCIKIENGEKATSPYGDFENAYIIVKYLGTGEGYSYYWYGKDTENVGIDTPKLANELTTKDISEGIGTISTAETVTGTTKTLVLNSDCKTFPEIVEQSSDPEPGTDPEEP